MRLAVRQYPEHVVQLHQLLYIDEAGYTVASIEPVRHEGQFVDFGMRVEWCVVVIEADRVPSEDAPQGHLDLDGGE